MASPGQAGHGNFPRMTSLRGGSALTARTLGSRTDAEDAVQEALLRAWRNLDSFRGGALFSTWLYRICVNAAARPARAAHAPIPPSATESADPRDRFVDHELSGELQRALAALDDDQRTAVVLYDVLGCSYAEIAEITGVAEGTVKSRLFRGRPSSRGSCAEPCGGGRVQVTMPERHPDDHDLLAYVEDDLADAERDAVRRHLEPCPRCAAQVAEREAGRALLQAAPTLELAPQRRAEILAGLQHAAASAFVLAPRPGGRRRAARRRLFSRSPHSRRPAETSDADQAGRRRGGSTAAASRRTAQAAPRSPERRSSPRSPARRGRSRATPRRRLRRRRSKRAR